MIEAGEGAPTFELPAVVGGEIGSVALSTYLGKNVVILAFYPADFNPACDDGETDLDELDLFTMQKDVTILAISGDSVYSHRAFADEYDLHIPLLADVHGEVAAAYGVAVDDEMAGYRTDRAVIVINPEGEVEFAWSTGDLEALPPVERVREAVDEVGGAETATARYRVGHAHYVEGRRALTSAMRCFEDNEWMMAQSDFMRAYEEFEEAASQFNTAARFGEDETAIAYFERAEDKAELLWQAAEWLADSASAYASGEGAEGQSMREDAETPLEEARRYHEPPDPDDFPPDEPPPPLEDEDEDDEPSFLPDDEEEVDTSLDVDIDETAGVDDGPTESAPAGAVASDEAASTAAAGPDEAADDVSAPVDASPAESDRDEGADASDGDEEAEAIDEAELEEITAELEQQTEAAQAERDEGADEAADGDGVDGGSEGADQKPDGAATADDESAVDGGDDADEVEALDLTDPTDGEGLAPLEDSDEAADDGTDGDDEGDESEAADEDEGDESGATDEDDESAEENLNEDLGSGGHGVPDSL